MRIALVDDDKQQLQALQQDLDAALQQLHVHVQELSTYTSGEEFLAAWKPDSLDLVILDIYMGGQSGVDVARRIREDDDRTLLAFCTSSNEFASESYEVGAGYYLQKPISPSKITSMLKRLDLSRIERSRTIRLPDGSLCLLRSIAYTEYHNHTVTFHMDDHSSRSVYMNHAEAENLLLRHGNFRCINKGCIVNFSLVQKLHDGAFLMHNGEMLPISRRRLKQVQEEFTLYRFKRMDWEVSL